MNGLANCPVRRKDEPVVRDDPCTVSYGRWRLESSRNAQPTVKSVSSTYKYYHKITDVTHTGDMLRKHRQIRGYETHGYTVIRIHAKHNVVLRRLIAREVWIINSSMCEVRDLLSWHGIFFSLFVGGQKTKNNNFIGVNLSPSCIVQ